jgi:pyruvate/2-oxoglutarate/acetoin dehydrogenase E1 component
MKLKETRPDASIELIDLRSIQPWDWWRLSPS